MQVTVTFHSSFRQVSGTDRLEIKLPEGSPVSALLEVLRESFQNPLFREHQASALINHKVARPETALQEGDEVLLLPVMDGG
jgi:molybdopterin converting factor small subunit